MRNTIIALFVASLCVLIACNANAQQPRARPTRPEGQGAHPIGIANSVDALKTFVEAEGCFSPGVGTYGVNFWIWDGHQLIAPTQVGVTSERGLPSSGRLMPWTTWKVGDVSVRTELCQVERDSPAGKVQVVGRSGALSNGRAWSSRSTDAGKI